MLYVVRYNVRRGFAVFYVCNLVVVGLIPLLTFPHQSFGRFSPLYFLAGKHLPSERRQLDKKETSASMRVLAGDYHEPLAQSD